MVKYTIRRFVEMLFTLFVIATGTFFLLAAVPGDALTARADKLPEKVRVNLYKRYGLDKPLLERYGITMKGMLKGDFGESVIYEGETVSNIIKTKGPVSARLGIQQMLLGVAFGLLLGILPATRKGTWIDYSIVFFSILLISVPPSRLWYPASESLCWKPTLIPDDRMAKGDLFTLWFGGWEYTILPTLTGCFVYIASYARLLKTSMLDVMNQEYILTAESKGLSKGKVIRRHVLRNSFIPVITNLPMSVAMCITGSYFIEKIFVIPGFGKYYVEAISGRDVCIVMGQTVITAALYIAVVFLTDILYTVVDPRIRISGGKK